MPAYEELRLPLPEDEPTEEQAQPSKEPRLWVLDLNTGEWTAP